MTCRHSPGDPNCSSTIRAQQRVTEEKQAKRVAKASAQMSTYEILRVERVGAHVVLEVLYPNCPRCTFEGKKVMVFLNVAELDLLRWKKIDPHFRATDPGRPSTEAPGPAARFPSTVGGWEDAVAYAKTKLTF